MNVVHLLINSAERFPDKTAVKFKNNELSYQELQNKVLKLATGLSGVGIGKNMNVGLMMQNGFEYIISYFAILAVGGTVVPINPQLKEKELTYLINDSEAKALLFDELSLETVDNTKTELITANILIKFLGQNNPSCDWTKLLDSPQLDEYELAFLKGNDTAQIIYTSGTTGRPKGAMITHNNVLWMVKALADVRETNEGDRVLVVAPLFHAFAKVGGFLGSFYKGATIILEERFNPDKTLELIDCEKITVFNGLPTMFAKIIQSPKLKEYNYSSLRILGSGGASIPGELLKRIKADLGVEVLEGYGQTESTVCITTQRPREVKVVGSVGIPIPGVELRIVTPDNQDVPQGEVGEIIFRGPNAFKGYYNKPEATAETISNSWVYSGDLGYQDEKGNLFIVDRKKDMIIRSGYNVFPREIEEYLYAHPAILECAVIGEPDDIVGEEIVAYVVTKNEITEEELSSYCRKSMAKYKVPRIFRFMDELPKTTTGKITKVSLRKNKTLNKTK
ncbi:long-chain acyl-CoA synthetase [Neobacillus niacini]|uniref:class I adenylate-forming enzyme family protein n=1 Tax=Neobacillus niacini TaxID=86668 RepID=UPI00278336E4|nr:long-chain-fatty-acid--CoA ligase [Neobacillus niacini]MDQ1002197.1 long-chain acyl-CoA synthetase [Neobacillus niacini]